MGEAPIETLQQLDALTLFLSVSDEPETFIGQLTPEDHTQVIQLIQEYIQQASSPLEVTIRRSALGLVLGKETIPTFLNTSNYHSMQELPFESYKETFDHPIYEHLFALFLQHPEVATYELAWLGNLLGTNTKDQLRTLYTPKITDSPMTMQFSHEDWFMCTSAEWRMFTSAINDELMWVYDKNKQPITTLKLAGKFAGIVTESFETPDNFIVPKGIWISPTDIPTRTALRNTYDYGRTSFLLQRPSSWTFLRGVQPENAQNIFKLMNTPQPDIMEVIQPSPDTPHVRRPSTFPTKQQLIKAIQERRKNRSQKQEWF